MKKYDRTRLCTTKARDERLNMKNQGEMWPKKAIPDKNKNNNNNFRKLFLLLIHKRKEANSIT